MGPINIYGIAMQIYCYTTIFEIYEMDMYTEKFVQLKMCQYSSKYTTPSSHAQYSES